jgi:hypothetical protein
VGPGASVPMDTEEAPEPRCAVTDCEQAMGGILTVCLSRRRRVEPVACHELGGAVNVGAVNRLDLEPREKEVVLHRGSGWHRMSPVRFGRLRGIRAEVDAEAMKAVRRIARLPRRSS